MDMTRRLTEEEKRENLRQREERQRQKDMSFRLDERSYEMLRILRDSPKHPEVKYNSKYFARHFKVSEPTIFRLVQTLRDNDILEKKQIDGSYAIDPSFNDSFYSEETQKNIALVASLRGLLQQYKDTPLFESVTKLIYFLQPEVAKKDAVLSSGRIIVSPQMEYAVDARKWNKKVNEAIQKNHKLIFRYTKSYTNTEAQRIVWPFQLILENGSVYLWAYSEFADLILMYDLNFMADIAVTDDSFELPKNFDINDYSGGGRLGAFAGDGIEEFRIRFTGYAKDWIKNHKWADGQTFTEEENSTVISFSSNQFEKVLTEILGWGRQAEPLSPDRLVKRCKEEVLAMAKKAEEK